MPPPRPTPRRILPGYGRPPDSWGGHNSAINRAYANRKAAEYEAAAEAEGVQAAAQSASAALTAAAQVEAAAMDAADQAEAAAHAQALLRAEAVRIEAAAKAEATARATDLARVAAQERLGRISQALISRVMAEAASRGADRNERMLQLTKNAEADIRRKAVLEARALNQAKVAKVEEKLRAQRDEMKRVALKDQTRAVADAVRGEAVRRSVIRDPDSDDPSTDEGLRSSDDGIRSRMAERLALSGHDINDPALLPFLQRRAPSGDSGLDGALDRMFENQTDNMEEDSPAEYYDEEFPEYTYNFNHQSRYYSGGPTPGRSTAVDRLTLHRKTGDDVWMTVPKGMKVPRLDGNHESDATAHEKACIARGVVCRDHLLRLPPGTTKGTVRPPDSPPLLPPASHAPPVQLVQPVRPACPIPSNPAPQNLRDRLQAMGMAVPIDLSRRTPTESDTSGSNFSEDGRMDIDGEDGEDESDGSNNQGPPAGQTDEEEDNDDDDSEHVSDADGEPIDRKGKGVDPRERGVIHSRDAGGDPDDDPSSDDGSDDGSEEGEDDGTQDGEEDDADDAEKAAAGELVSTSISHALGLAFITLGKSKRKGGRTPNAHLQGAEALRADIDRQIDGRADAIASTYEAVYRDCGLGQPPRGRDVNLWNLFNQVMREEWADIPDNLGKNFTKKVSVAYIEATKGLDKEGEALLRKNLLAKAKRTAKKEPNETGSMLHITKAMRKMVCFSSYRSMNLLMLSQ